MDELLLAVDDLEREHREERLRIFALSKRRAQHRSRKLGAKVLNLLMRAERPGLGVLVLVVCLLLLHAGGMDARPLHAVMPLTDIPVAGGRKCKMLLRHRRKAHVLRRRKIVLHRERGELHEEREMG